MTRRGFTIIELLVTLALLAILLAVAPLVRTAGVAAAGSRRAELAATRRRAINNGAAMSGRSDSLGRFTALPDGSIVADSIAAIQGVRR